MNPMRLALIGVAIAVVAGVFYLFFSGDPAPPPPAVEVELPKIETEDVLTAARDVPIGTIISDLDLRWVPWPYSAISPIMITKSIDPSAILSLKGSIARTGMMDGEPVRREKLVKPSNAGFISAVLPGGMRAVSIPIDAQGTSNAGGFILPNDHVDVMRAGRVGESVRADIIASDITVLAIGRNYQELTGGDHTMQGPNVTLEVTPEQAQDIAVAQLGGGVSLVLRSLLDSGKATLSGQEKSLSVIRFGIESELIKR